MNKQMIKLSQLEGLLKGVADDLRGKMDAADYKEYIMGMLFLKRCVASLRICPKRQSISF